MAQRVLVRRIDDLDGSEADADVRFGLDGKPYEIDLSAANAARLRGVLAPYIAAGSRIGRASGGAGRRGQRVGSGSAERRSDGAAVRRWANEHGHDVGTLGRIPAEVVAAYDARDQASPAAPAAESRPAAGRREVDPLAYSAEVRQWAATNGHQVAGTGRMPDKVIAAYRTHAASGKRSGRQSAARRRAAPTPTFSG